MLVSVCVFICSVSKISHEPQLINLFTQPNSRCPITAAPSTNRSCCIIVSNWAWYYVQHLTRTTLTVLLLNSGGRFAFLPQTPGVLCFVFLFRTLKTFFLLDSSVVQFRCAPRKSTLLSGRLFPGFWVWSTCTQNTICYFLTAPLTCLTHMCGLK